MSSASRAQMADPTTDTEIWGAFFDLYAFQAPSGVKYISHENAVKLFSDLGFRHADRAVTDPKLDYPNFVRVAGMLLGQSLHPNTQANRVRMGFGLLRATQPGGGKNNHNPHASKIGAAEVMIMRPRLRAPRVPRAKP
mmetsp:Transcript_1889/g.5528  ORF Transcript_1889/g.5528 Transcript_1889/m.5528 type:complete len:138 (-) Transcript_1889:273-686(-)